MLQWTSSIQEAVFANKRAFCQDFLFPPVSIQIKIPFFLLGTLLPDLYTNAVYIVHLYTFLLHLFILFFFFFFFFFVWIYRIVMFFRFVESLSLVEKVIIELCICRIFFFFFLSTKLQRIYIYMKYSASCNIHVHKAYDSLGTFCSSKLYFHEESAQFADYLERFLRFSFLLGIFRCSSNICTILKWSRRNLSQHTCTQYWTTYDVTT